MPPSGSAGSIHLLCVFRLPPCRFEASPPRCWMADLCCPCVRSTACVMRWEWVASGGKAMQDSDQGGSLVSSCGSRASWLGRGEGVGSTASRRQPAWQAKQRDRGGHLRHSTPATAPHGEGCHPLPQPQPPAPAPGHTGANKTTYLCRTPSGSSPQKDILRYLHLS